MPPAASSSVSLVNHLALRRGVCFRGGKPVSSSIVELFNAYSVFISTHLDSIHIVKNSIVYILLTIAGAYLGCHQLRKYFFVMFAFWFFIDDTRSCELIFLLANSLLYL